MSEEYSDKRVEPTGGDEPEATEPTSGGADTPPPPPPASSDEGGDGSGGADNKGVMLVLSYLGILALIPWLVEKDDSEVQWHAKNGLVWTAAWIAIWFLLSILSFATGGLACLLGPVYLIFGLGIFVVHIMGMVKALQGERFRLPFLSDFVEKF